MRRSASHRAWLIAAAFTAACFVLEARFVGLTGSDYFGEILGRPHALLNFPIHFAGVAAIILVHVLFLWSSLVSGKAWRAVYFGVFAGATIFEYAWFHATGLLTNAHDIELVVENRPLWVPMASQCFYALALIPVGVYGALLAARGDANQMTSSRDGRRFAIVVVATVLVHSAYAASGYLHAAQQVGMTSEQAVPTGAFEAFARSVTIYAWNDAAGHFRVHMRQSVPDVTAAVPTTHIVLVIDESVSAGHLSVNGYARATTPWLEQLVRQGAATNWGVIASSTTQSSGSVACLLTGVTQLPDVDQRIYLQPTLFQYAKAMKYQTHLFDGESSTPRFGISYADLKFVDDWRTKVFGDDPETDRRMAEAVTHVLAEPQGQFVVVLKRGNHFPHARNVPPGAGEWLPAADTMGGNPQALAEAINSYDNAIRYNLDSFFQTLLGPSGVPARTVVLYTSDHGENLSDPDSNPLKRRLAWDTTGVPLIMFGDERPMVDTAYRASHRNLFPTLLDFLRVPASARTAIYSRSLLDARASDHDRRTVLGGSVMDPAAATADFDALARPLKAPGS
jgi:glucan phosphoethanolaminetransferase (alkaline phosphatase superfamily)